MRKQEEATTEKCSVDLRTTLFSLSQNELWMCVVEATKHPEMRSFCIPSFFRSLGGSVSHGVPQATRKCHVFQTSQCSRIQIIREGLPQIATFTKDPTQWEKHQNIFLIPASSLPPLILERPKPQVGQSQRTRSHVDKKSAWVCVEIRDLY